MGYFSKTHRSLQKSFTSGLDFRVFDDRVGILCTRLGGPSLSGRVSCSDPFVNGRCVRTQPLNAFFDLRIPFRTKRHRDLTVRLRGKVRKHLSLEATNHDLAKALGNFLGWLPPRPLAPPVQVAVEFIAEVVVRAKDVFP